MNGVSDTLDLPSYCRDLAKRARCAARGLAIATTDAKNDWLTRSASRLRRESAAILAASQTDLAAAPGYGLSAAQTDRLRLDPQRIDAIARALDDIAELPDPVGEIIEQTVRPNGMQLRKVRVPLGVILVIYESRPNVTADSAALCVKSGNAAILRGGKEALHTNRCLHRLLAGELQAVGLPHDAVQLVDVTDRAAVSHLLRLPEWIDLVIPRGGEGLIRRVADEARMPVMKHYQGICHVYVDATADPEMARRIVMNAKCQRPGTCNAAETLLVHRDIAPTFLPAMGAELREGGVELRGCATTQSLVPGVLPASDADYATEWLDLKMSVRVVDDVSAAIEHIARFGSAHTDAIVCRNPAVAQQFVARVDSAAVLVNASTRLCDGGEFGLGGEIGISTDKLHARGPCGLRELTSYKYVVYGDGQLRT
jgi:glutamate-5-semialdehyde dehydrogenase